MSPLARRGGRGHRSWDTSIGTAHALPPHRRRVRCGTRKGSPDLSVTQARFREHPPPEWRPPNWAAKARLVTGLNVALNAETLTRMVVAGSGRVGGATLS